MIKTILIIILSVSIAGIILFIYVRNLLKSRLNYILSKDKKKVIK